MEESGNPDVVFLRRMEASGRLYDSEVRKLPPMQEVLSYIAQLPERPLWFKSCQEGIVNSGTMTFPDVPVLTRDYIRDFMRTSKSPSEVVCSNPKCESERLGGFRIRALIVPGQELNYWCYLCHLFYTNRLYFESLNRKTDPRKNFVQIHHFMVRVDQPGEYRLEMTLSGEKDVRGLFGPFPLYNCHHYTPKEMGPGCRGWAESDIMVFRLSQTAPPSNRPPSSSATTTENIWPH